MVMKCRTLIIKTNTTIGNNMTIKNDLYIWVYKFGARRPKKIKLKKFVNAVNDTTFSQKFFTSEKEAKDFIKKDFK